MHPNSSGPQAASRETANRRKRCPRQLEAARVTANRRKRAPGN
jgi:hypothetical protein